MAHGFGNSPAGDMMLPEGDIPGITNVRYAGMTPYRNGVTNPPITTPQFPNNAPRATNKSPIALHPVVDNLTLTRPTHTMLGSLPAGGYRGAVGQVVRNTDQNVGAGLRGVMVSGRLGSHAPQGYRGYSGFNGLGTAPVTDAAIPLFCGTSTDISRVASFRVTSGQDNVNCIIRSGDLYIRAICVEGTASITYTLTAAPTVDHTVTINVTKSITLAEVVETATSTVKEIQAIVQAATGAAAPAIDWQDAEILRGNAPAIKGPLLELWKYHATGPTAMKELRQMMDILTTASANPSLQTLHDVLQKYSSDKGGTIATWVLPRCGSGGHGEPYGHAARVAAYAEDALIVMKVVNAVVQIVGTVLSSVFPAFALLIAACVAVVGMAAKALEGFSCKRLIRAFGAAIRKAALATDTAGITPIRLQGNALVRTGVVNTAGPLIAQAQAGYKGTAQQAEAFRAAFEVAQRACLDVGDSDPRVGLVPLAGYDKLLRDIKALRPDLCGITSSSEATVALLEGTMQTDTLYRAMTEYGAAASLIVLYFLFHNTPGAVIPVTLLTSPMGGTADGRRITYIARLQRAHTAYLAAIAAAPKPLAEMYRAPMIRTLTAVAMLGKGINAPGTRVLPAHPEVLAAAGIPATEFPKGYGEFLDPLPPGQEARSLTTVDALMSAQIPPTPPTPPAEEAPPVIDGDDTPEPGRDTGAGGGTDQPKASSNTPMLIGGAVVLGIGAFLLLRK